MTIFTIMGRTAKGHATVIEVRAADAIDALLLAAGSLANPVLVS